MGIFESPCPFLYGNHHMEMVIPVWNTFPYGDFYLNPQMGTNSLFGNGLVTEPSPFGNGDPFLYGDPHIETGIRSICFPIWKRGLKERLHFHMGMCLSPFPYMVITICKWGAMPSGSIWKWGFTLSIWGCVYPRFHMVIAIWKR